MRARSLEQRITVQVFSESTNSIGETTREWSDAHSTFARVVHQKGDESFTAAQQVYSRTLKFLIRKRNDITVQNRIKYGAEYFDVYDVDQATAGREGTWITASLIPNPR